MQRLMGWAISLVVFGLAAACGSSQNVPLPTTADALVETALTAIETGDVETMTRLLYTADDFKRACPGYLATETDQAVAKRTTEQVARTRQRMRRECDRIDWGSAQRINVERMLENGPAANCPQIVAYSDVSAHYDVDGIYVRVKFDEPQGHNELGIWRFAQAPHCKIEDGSPPW